MGILKWRNFTLISFYLIYLFTCYNVSATSTQIMSNAELDDLGDLVDICSLPLCGKGKCQPQPGFLNFTCDCDSGWKKLKVGPIESCALPNCTVNLECGDGKLPTALPKLPSDANPCLFNLCGDGNCVREGSDFKCQCNEGSANILNDPKMFCLKKCGVGGDCGGLDLGGFFTPEVAPPPPPPPPPPNSGTEAAPPPATPNSGSGSSGTGSGDMLNCSKKLYMLTIMILAMISQNWI